MPMLMFLEPGFELQQLVAHAPKHPRQGIDKTLGRRIAEGAVRRWRHISRKMVRLRRPCVAAQIRLARLVSLNH